MSEHTDKRDYIAREIAVAIRIGMRRQVSQKIIRVTMAEPNLIEVEAEDGTVYTARVCQRRNTAY